MSMDYTVSVTRKDGSKRYSMFMGNRSHGPVMKTGGCGCGRYTYD
jgi:hypothetical protein